MDFSESTFDFDHLVMGELSVDQHIAVAVLCFRYCLQTDPETLEDAKDLRRRVLMACSVTSADCDTIISRATKIAIAKESH
ncbi:protein of unknown function [Nitrospira japonica]|uniref:Uncharacterized protein n=1 Tax=Nitrospira japonica TaxID=1325564 RepID=A0A1W1I1P7_9BACT|nr:protein of unknown function [Nitrospira japonica]